MKMRKIFIVLLIILGIVFGYDELDERKFVESELEFSFEIQGLSKYSKDLKEAPAFISIIFSEEMKLFYYRDVSELLNFSPGLYVVSDGAFWYLGSRGIQIPGSYNSRALFLINGYPINELVFGTPYMDYNPRFLGSVEIVNGYSNVYSGSNSLVSTINFIPKFLEDERFNFRINHSYYFSNGYWGGDSYINLKFGDPVVNLGFNLSSYSGSNIFLPQRNELSIKDDNNHLKHAYLFTRILSNNSHTDLYFSFLNKRFHYPVGSFGITLNDRNDFSVENSNYFYIKHLVNLSGNSFISVNSYYHNAKEYAQYPTVSQGFINVDYLRSKVFSLDLNYYKLSGKNSFLVGMEYKNISFNLDNFDVDYYDKFLINRNLVLNRIGLPISSFYFSYDFRIKEDFIFSSSFRYDNYYGLYSNFRSIFIPQFGLVKLKGNESWKLVYSQNYRSPSISEAFYNDGGISTLDNPFLAPEKHRTIELIYYKEIRNRFKKGYFSSSIYKMNISDLINFVDVGTNSFGIVVSQYKNVADVEVVGSLIDYCLYFRDREFIRFAYSYSNALVKGQLSFLSNSPKHLFLVKYARRVSDRFWVSFENKYTSEVLDDYSNRVSGFSIANLNLVYNWNDEKSITISVNNLFNVKGNYVIGLSNNYPVSIYPVKSRNVCISLDFKF